MGVREIPLTLAVNDYDHVRDLVSGIVAVDGVELTCLQMRVEEIFFRFVRHREWHVSELSMAKFTTMRGRGEEVVGIPVFPSRMFRHAAFFVREEALLHTLTDLAGARIGVPEWTMTATVYARGLLADSGVPLEGIRWVQAGLDEPGRTEGVSIELPPGIQLTPAPEATLTGLLQESELDAIITARPPAAFARPGSGLRRLLADPLAEEEAFYRATGIFPIMHVIALRADVHEQHPWVAMNLLKAFEEAKRRSLERAFDTACSRYPIPFAAPRAEAERELSGADPWPYGIEPNRVTLEAFLRYCDEQGLTERRLEPEELFVPEVLTAYRV